MTFFVNFLVIGGLLSSFLVIFSANPVHSVLSLILVFCFSSLLLLTLNGDFLAILFIVVYVGAIAVLFLFVIMMLNVKIVQLSESTIRWIPVGSLVVLGILCELYILFAQRGYFSYNNPSSWVNLVWGADNLELLGNTIYSFFYFPFLIAGLILLIALIGAIVLTVGYRRGIRRQAIYKQVGRNLFGTVKFYK